MIIPEFKTKYGTYKNVRIRLLQYPANNTPAIQLYTDEPLLTATVCLVESGEKPADGNIFIKNYSENEGVYEELKRHGIVGDAVREFAINQFGSMVVEAPLVAELTLS